MTTWVLTPDTPDPITGFANPVIGWQFSFPTALDTLEGANIIFAAGWVTQMGPLATSTANPPEWQLIIKKQPIQIIANNTDYFVTDGQNVWTIPLETVQANYTVLPQEGS
jgi:hypothetical protein